MNCLKLGRRYLNLVLGGEDGLYSMSRMDVSGLFYRSTAEAQAEMVKAKEKMNGIDKLQLMGSIGRLPRPRIQYQSFSSEMSHGHSLVDVFAPFGKSKIFCASAEGCASVYNTESNSFLGLPMLNSPKGPKCIAVSIRNSAACADQNIDRHQDVGYYVEDDMPHGNTDSLYLMDMVPDKPCCFEVLHYCTNGSLRWCPLPLPPFFNDPEYKTPGNVPFAVVGDTKICVSTATATYSFDTVACKWSKMGDWVLPFHAKAEYAPELGLWFGLLAHSSYDMCALNLSTTTTGSLPSFQHFRLDLVPPENWSLVNATLVNLGSGKFCIVKFFDIIYEDESGPQVVVFTGVEVSLDDDHQDASGLHMIPHKSKCIISDSIDCVL
ncbi:unnamed protein product [Urochloa humidicola]